LLEKEANERAMSLVAGAIIFSSYISLFLFLGGFPLYSFSSGVSARLPCQIIDLAGWVREKRSSGITTQGCFL